jgi:hypothetical protein
MRTLIVSAVAALLLASVACGKQDATGTSSGSTSSGTTAGAGSTSGSGSGSTGTGPTVCSGCTHNLDCGVGGTCVGPGDGGPGNCALPCDAGSCADPQTTCYPVGGTTGRGCYPSSESCSGFIPSSGSTGH